MSIYIFFGKSGSGKSFLANYLQTQYNIFHFDGDQILTEEMQAFVRTNQIFTAKMVNDYTLVLKSKINELLTMDKPVIISQGLYRNKNRLEILQEFPSENIQFVLITASANIRYSRISRRNNWVTLDYAKKINTLFEPPQGFHYSVIENNSEILPTEKLLAIFNSDQDSL